MARKNLAAGGLSVARETRPACREISAMTKIDARMLEAYISTMSRTRSADLDDILPALTAAVVAEMGLRRPGRPKANVTKQRIGLRLDRDIIAAFRATGPGWNTRMNDALRRAIEGERAA